MEVLRKENIKNRIFATVEERRDGMYISTVYDNLFEVKSERKVVVFETYSAALAHMYETMFTIAKSGLDMVYKTGRLGRYESK